jgi:hypothetical protein
MLCSICGIEIDDIENAVDEGWIPSFYDGDTDHEFACSGCSKSLLQVGDDGEMELKPEYQGKILYGQAEPKESLVIGIAIVDPRLAAKNN